jgi:lysozyme family protein
MAAVEYSADNAALVKEICGRRMAYLKSLRTWPYFGRGWSRRVAQVQAAGVAQASQGAHVALVSPTETEDAKAPITSLPKPAVNPTTGGAVSAGGITGTTAVQSLQDATNTLSPYADTITYIKYALLAIAVISIAITIYATIRANKNKKVEEAEGYEPVEELATA